MRPCTTRRASGRATPAQRSCACALLARRRSLVVSARPPCLLIVPRILVPLRRVADSSSPRHRSSLRWAPLLHSSPSSSPLPRHRGLLPSWPPPQAVAQSVLLKPRLGPSSPSLAAPVLDLAWFYAAASSSTPICVIPLSPSRPARNCRASSSPCRRPVFTAPFAASPSTMVTYCLSTPRRYPRHLLRPELLQPRLVCERFICEPFVNPSAHPRRALVPLHRPVAAPLRLVVLDLDLLRARAVSDLDLPRALTLVLVPVRRLFRGARPRPRVDPTLVVLVPPSSIVVISVARFRRRQLGAPCLRPCCGRACLPAFVFGSSLLPSRFWLRGT